MNQEPLHKRLERLRKASKISATEMALRIGAAESTYREWEKGRGMKLPPLLSISQVLAISVTELLSGQKPNLNDVVADLEKAESELARIKANLASRI